MWSLAPYGPRVLVAAASAVMTPALEAWHVALREDPTFARKVGDDLVLTRARDAVIAALHTPTDEATAELHVVASALAPFLRRVELEAYESPGDADLHKRMVMLAACIEYTVRAATWTEADARRDAHGDAAEEASRIATGPALEAASAVTTYARLCPAHRAEIVRWIADLVARLD